MEFIEMLTSECDYIGTPDTSTPPGEYNQYDDVGEPMSDIALVGPAEIGTERAKSINLFRILLLNSDFY